MNGRIFRAPKEVTRVLSFHTDLKTMRFDQITQYFFYLLMEKFEKFSNNEDVKVFDSYGTESYQMKIILNNEKITVQYIPSSLLNRIEFYFEGLYNPSMIISAGYENERGGIMSINKNNPSTFNGVPMLRVSGKNICCGLITDESFKDLPQSELLHLIKEIILPLSDWIEEKRSSGIKLMSTQK